MKVLVTEIEKEELIEFLPIFGLDSQITILEDPTMTEKSFQLKSRTISMKILRI